MRAALDQESTNFLDFVRAELAVEVSDDGELAEEQEVKSVAFHDLLPPREHTKVVAAQAFLHVLVLAGKGLMSVRQEVGYGPIRMEISAGA